MNFIVLHADRLSTVLSDDPIVAANDLAPLASAQDLLAEASRLRAVVDAEAATARAAARAEGFTAGQLEGRTAGAAEIREELLQLALRDQRAQAGRRDEIARLALEVVRRIAGEIGEAKTVAAIARQVVSSVAPDEKVVVRVPSSAAAETANRLADFEQLIVEADPTLAANDCVVETSLGSTHAGLTTQLAHIERAWSEHNGRG